MLLNGDNQIPIKHRPPNPKQSPSKGEKTPSSITIQGKGKKTLPSCKINRKKVERQGECELGQEGNTNTMDKGKKEGKREKRKKNGRGVNVF